MRNYYYLVISLPALEFTAKPQISFLELVQGFDVNLTHDDLNFAKVLFLYFDLINIERTLEKEPLDSRGQLSSTDLIGALRFKDYFPDFVFDFFDKEQTDSEKLANFSQIYSQFFTLYAEGSTPAAQILKFERELRLFLTAFRAKKFGKDFSHEFRFEDPNDSYVYSLLIQKESAKLVPPEQFEELMELIESEDDAVKIRTIIEEFRFNHYQDLQEENSFTIIGLLAYMMQLVVVEDLEVTDPNYGLEMFNYLLKENHEQID
jgi:hypothetical protein